jgi:ABC-2 type transport system ATP-binding protein
MHAIETFALTKRFRRVAAVRELNLEVGEGSVYALMGPNGAGKTTLIKLLMNLISPTAGRAMMLGSNASQLQGKGLETIGYVSENQKLPDWMTVESFLSYWRPFYPKWDRALEQRLVKRFNLPRKQKLKHLSRGMRMKAALTSALAFHPRLIVLDEPLSGLDPLVRDDLMEGLAELAGETTVLLSSHDLAEIDSFASHVGYMDEGRLLLSEPMTSVRERFRKIEIAGDAPLESPATVPAEWLQFTNNTSGANADGARWIETGYDAVRSLARAREVFGAVELRASAMTLREVFLALARAGRPADANGGPQWK